MTSRSDARFVLLLEAPAAYDARSVAGRGAVTQTPLSSDAEDIGAFKPLKRATRAIGRAASRTGRLALQANPVALSARTAQFAGRGLALATGPLRRRILRAFFGKLTARRARLLAWQGRRALRPSSDEQRAARTWAVRYVKRRGILGKLVGTALSGDSIGEAATTAIVTASIPVLIELARRALRAAESQGAPADPRAVQPAAPGDEAEPAE